MDRLTEAIVRVLGLTVSAAALLAAQADDGLEAQHGQAVIRGTVYDANSREPLDKVEVKLIPEGSGRIKAIRTGVAGEFVFEEVEPGTYKLTAVKNGYVHAEYIASEGVGLPAQLVVLAGQDRAGIAFRLEPTATLVGRVVDQDGDSLVGARVLLNEPTFFGGQLQLVPRASGESNDLGEYRIHNIKPGAYYLSVDYEDHLLRDSAVSYEGPEEGSYTRTYYPGVIDSDEATAVRLQSGETRAVDFHLRRVSAVRISGTLGIVGGGALPPNTSVEMMPDGDLLARLRRRFADADRQTGKFAFARVPPGSYVLIASEEVANTRLYLFQPLQVLDRDIDNLDLTLARGATVSGAVLVEGQSVAQFSFNERRLGVSLYGPPRNPGNTSAQVDRAGAFVITAIAPMEYSVGVNGFPPDAYLKTVLLSGRELPDWKLSLSPGESIDEVTAVVSLDGGYVGGVVLDENEHVFGGATVIAFPQAELRERRGFKVEQTDELGRYVMRGLAPGRYRLLAFDEIEPGAYWQPEFLGQFGDEGEAVKVEELSRLALDLRLTTVKH